MDFQASGARRRWVLATMALLLGVAFVRPAWSDPRGPNPNDRYTTKAVVVRLQSHHLSRHPIDGEIAKRMITLFLKELDPMKMYFYQSDVDALTARQDELVEKARRGDVSPAYSIFALYLQRMDERVKMVDSILATPPDFTLKEEMVSDRESAQYAIDPADAREKWRKRIKYELLMLRDDNKEKQEKKDKDGKEIKEEVQDPVERLTRRYHGLLKRTHQTDGEELLEMYLNALTSSFDPHTNYMSPSTVNNFEIQMRLQLEGIGAALQFNDGYTVVNKLIPGGAAEKDGRLKPEDKIVGVGQGREGEIVDVVDMKLSDVVKLIRGKRGTVVRLQAISAGSNEKRIIDIVRERVELKDSEARAKIFKEMVPGGNASYSIGIIDLPSFYMDMEGARQGLPDYKSTTRDVARILADFNAQNVDAVILDLRRNGGGSLTEAITLTGLFIEEGPVVQVKGPDGQVQPYKDTDSSVLWNKPLVVVTSKFSASASEILAGAIQDYQRGLIVGDHTTHGKGTVQSLLDLGQELLRIPNAPSMGALKITVQQFYRPNGDSTQKRGVPANVELPSLTTHLDVGEADLDYHMAFDHVDPVRFKTYGWVTPEIDRDLSARSAERCTQSSDFQRVLRQIARYKEQKERKRVSLNEKTFTEERAEINADKAEAKKLEEMANADRAGIVRDFYMNEVVAITVDYLNLLRKVVQPALAGPRQSAAPAHP